VDAHKGDGTAAITAGDDSIATLSIHMAAGWPLDQPERGATGARTPSFHPQHRRHPGGAGEEPVYNQRLKGGLERLAMTGTPDLALVVCGADPYELDELPSTAGPEAQLGPAPAARPDGLFLSEDPRHPRRLGHGRRLRPEFLARVHPVSRMGIAGPAGRVTSRSSFLRSGLFKPLVATPPGSHPVPPLVDAGLKKRGSRESATA